MKKRKNAALRWAAAVVGRSKGYIAALCALQTLTGLGGVAYALLLRWLVDSAVDGERRAFFTAAAVFASVVLVMTALGAASRLLSDCAVSKVENDLKKRLFSTLLTKDYARVAGVHSGEWLNRLTSDASLVASESVQLIPGVLGLAVRLIGSLVAVVALEKRLLYILVPCAFLFLFLSYGLRGLLKRLHKKLREADGRLRVFMQERLGSLLVVRAFSAEKQSVAEAEGLMKAHRGVRIRRSLFSNAASSGFALAMNGLFLAGALFCGYGILTGSLSYGSLTAVMQLIGQVRVPLASLSGVLPGYYAAIASAERIMEAESFPDDLPTPALSASEIDKLYKTRFKGLALENVDFSYGTSKQSAGAEPAPVFTGLSLEIKKGAYVAITGPSGCGKSTLLKLLMCIYRPDGGGVKLLTDLGGERLSASYRGLFAYVPQGSRLMNGTVRAAVTLGAPERLHDDAAIYDALRIACADDFVRELDGGLDAELGERGAGLSEGQLQRLAIARALFTGRPVLVLDECTASLDGETEQRLLANLRAMTDRTVLLVTHRPAALSLCDSVIAL